MLGAILLGPGLIAAIYGANVDLPGRDRLTGTILLIIGMIIVSGLSLVAVRMIQRPKQTTDERRPISASGREGTDEEAVDLSAPGDRLLTSTALRRYSARAGAMHSKAESVALEHDHLVPIWVANREIRRCS